MKVLVYSTKPFEKPFLQKAFAKPLQVVFTHKALSVKTAALAKDCKAVCIFTNDDASLAVIELLCAAGVKHIAIRAAGYDNIDLKAAQALHISVANVPEYSPYAIAEHAVALMLALNRKLILANKQVHQRNFTLDNLVGFDLRDKFVGIIGTGRIGKVLAKIMTGFGCTVMAHDLLPDADLEENYDVQYSSLNSLCENCDIISIHLPLTKDTKHLIGAALLAKMKKGVMLINTSRGGVLHTGELLPFLKNGHVGAAGLDVYEYEKGLFFFNHRSKPLRDPLLKRLLRFPNVLVTPHQAFATEEALQNIASAAARNLFCWAKNKQSENELTPAPVAQGKAVSMPQLFA